MSRLPLGVLCSCLVLVTTACNPFAASGRAKQFRTFADLQVMAARLDEAISKSAGRLDANEASRIVASINGGRDAWGSQVIVHVESRDERVVYVLVSCGSDRKLDLPKVQDYFFMAPHDIHGQGEKDIVFRDGEPITRAGK